jgi:5'-deoxynucleotidase YfbR-like HD superfamily hydrolase
MKQDDINLIGKKFGKLTIVELVKVAKNNGPNRPQSKRTHAICSCECGTKSKLILLSNLKSGSIKSCGCLQPHSKEKGFNPRMSSAAQAFSGRYSDGNLTFEQFLILTQENCFYCKAPPANCTNTFKTRKRVSEYAIDNGDFIYNGLDRVDSTKPHNYDNVVPCCLRCNKSKLDRSVEEFAQWIVSAYEWAKSFQDTRQNENTWIQTYTGKKFYPLNPKMEDVCIEDIAHSLSEICRFTGHVKQFYSVAQHSVGVSLLCKTYPLHGLLHDQTEAFLGDVSSPLKHSGKFEIYRFYENRLQSVMNAKFGLLTSEPEEVKRSDLVMLATEARDLLEGGPHPEFHLDYEPFPEKIVPLPPPEAKALFLARYKELTAEQKAL